MTDAQLQYLVEKDVPSVEAVINLPDGNKVHFFGIHPKTPPPTENKTSLPRDAELIIVGKKAKSSNLPVIIAGDLNDVAWSHTSRLFLRTSQLLDPRMGRGFFNTYHAGYQIMRWPLDHLFVSGEFRIISMKRLAYFGSDHFPICAEVSLNPEIQADSDVENLSKSDISEINNKLHQQKYDND